MAKPEFPQGTKGRAFVHEALFYRTLRTFAEQVSAFVRAGQDANEPVLAVLPPDSLECAQAALAGRGAAVRWEPMHEVGRNPNRLLSVYQDWIDAHTGPVRVIAEAIWPGRSYAETTECLRHEALLNHELADAPVSALCPFDADRLDGEVLAGAALTHPWLVDEAGRRRPSEHYDEPLTVASGARWPQPEPAEPISEHVFYGDLQSLRHAVAEDPIAARLDREHGSDLVLVISEAASNAIKHGDGTGIVRLWGVEDGVVGEVATRSSLEDALAGRRRPRWDATGGRGLWLINQICDLVELRSEARTTVLRMHLRTAGPAFDARARG